MVDILNKKDDLENKFESSLIKAKVKRSWNQLEVFNFAFTSFLEDLCYVSFLPV